MKKLLKNASLLLITLVFSFGFIKSVYADCSGATGGSDECRETDNRTIWVAGNAYGGYDYRPLKQATATTRVNVQASSSYWGGGLYDEIGVAIWAPDGRRYQRGFAVSKDSYSIYFCLDSQLEGGHTLYAERFLGTIDGKKYQALDYAFLSVLTANGGPMTSVSASNAADYWARLMALRALGFTFGVNNSSNVKYMEELYAGYTTLGNWLKEDSSVYDALNSALGGTLTSKSKFNNNGFSFSGSPVEQAKRYYFDALSAALNYVNNMSDEVKIDTTSVLPVPGDIITTEKPEGVFVEEDVVHTIKVSGLANDGENEFVIDGITLDKEIDGLTYYIKSIQIGETVIEDQEAIKGMLGQNLLAEGSGYDFTNETTILITAHFEGYESSDDPNVTVLKCGQAPIEYHIGGSYKAEGTGLFSEYTATVWYSGEMESQKFLGIEEGGGATDGDDWTSPYVTYLIDACNCDDLIEACIASEDINSDECQQLFEADCGECAELEVECALGDQEACEEYGAVCEVECPTTVSNFDCCDAANNLIISTADDHEVDILGPEDVRACFVSQIDAQVEQNGSQGAIGIAGAKDDVENSYSLYDIKDQNKYCHVSCKEDYMMTMPTAKLVNAGRYFTFKASVEGEKICYTNTINKGDIETPGSYAYDIKAAQEAMIEAYNEFRKWEELAKVPIEEVFENYAYDASCDTHGCGPSTDTKEYSARWHVEATVSDWQTVSNVEFDTGVVTTNQGANGVVYEDTHKELRGEDTVTCSGGTYYNEYLDREVTCSGGSTTVYRGEPEEVKTQAEFKQDIINNREAARAALKAAKEAYEAIIEMFHDCTNDSWSSEMNYDPDVYYDYEESYLTDMYNDRGEMDRTINSESTDEQWFCIGDIGDENYEVCNGQQLSSRDATFVQRSYWVCEDEKRCHTEDRSYYYNISDADYLKKTSNTEVSYVPSTLFYNVYPSGEIVDRDEGAGREDTVALENKLPVSLSTERGIYKYTVNMGNLGEYYDQQQDGNLGRLIDGEDSGNNPVINKKDYTDYVNEEGYVEYACSYLVNMGITDEDTIICDFDTLCTGDDCYADCIGPNCDYECYGEDCIADCIGAGCIYDSDAGSSMIERVVSLNNLFPNGTDSYNWNREENEKAATTIDEIQEAGNSVYDGDPILSVTITPDANRAIKAYNDEYEGSDGGYSNSTLDCYDLGSYQEIACYSTFINDILNGTYGEVVNDRSLILGNNYRTVGDNNTQYFTLWNGTISETDMLGPSWK